MTENTEFSGASCPLPLNHVEKIVLGHGSGGKMTFNLINRIFKPFFENPYLAENNDSARFNIPEGCRIAMSTDAHVVDPLFFAGGDIGKLAICGTVNDIAMMGAIPLYLTAGFILEEGLEVSLLEKVISSMRDAADEADVEIIAGDTKVVQKGKADGLYITTTGFGKIPPGVDIHGANAQVGDVVIISGAIGNHGIAVLEGRGDLGFRADVESDIAPLNHLVQEMLKSGCSIHVLRDPTRGGVGTSLNEIASQSSVSILIEEDLLPIDPKVSAVCELLGYDPLYIANEGKLIAILPEKDAQVVLDVMHQSKYGRGAAIIGKVVADSNSNVLMKTRLNTTRVVDVLSGEMLPRIC